MFFGSIIVCIYIYIQETESTEKLRVEGYEKVQISWDIYEWGGLAKTIHDISIEGGTYCLPTLLDGSVSTSLWYYAIGKYKCSTTYVNKYPSYEPAYSQVVLWLRIKPNIQITFICDQKMHLHLLIIYLSFNQR